MAIGKYRKKNTSRIRRLKKREEKRAQWYGDEKGGAGKANFDKEIRDARKFKEFQKWHH